ncbi:MAG: hypothetical protein AB1750_03745 [Chloroflexota bacterium]
MSKKASAKQKALAMGLILVGLLIAGFFGMGMLRAARQFRGRPPMPPPGEVETDVELIRDWMTVPFVAHTYRVPGTILFDALRIPPEGNEEKSLRDLNREYYPSDPDFVLAKVKETILANQPPLTPDLEPAPTSPTPAQPWSQ